MQGDVQVDLEWGKYTCRHHARFFASRVDLFLIGMVFDGSIIGNGETICTHWRASANETKRQSPWESGRLAVLPQFSKIETHVKAIAPID
jgi:hypothetical protein